jgi:hypothetical protein
MHGQGSSVTLLTWRTPCNHHQRLYQTHLLLGVLSIHCVQHEQQLQFSTMSSVGPFQGGRHAWYTYDTQKLKRTQHKLQQPRVLQRSGPLR